MSELDCLGFWYFPVGDEPLYDPLAVALRLEPSTASHATLACTTPAGGAAARAQHWLPRHARLHHPFHLYRAISRLSVRVDPTFEWIPPSSGSHPRVDPTFEWIPPWQTRQHVHSVNMHAALGAAECDAALPHATDATERELARSYHRWPDDPALAPLRAAAARLRLAVRECVCRPVLRALSSLLGLDGLALSSRCEMSGSDNTRLGLGLGLGLGDERLGKHQVQP